MKFCYNKARGISDIEELLDLIQQIKSEKNKISLGFNNLKSSTITNALHSQAMLHLKQEYCDKNECLQCRLGNKILSGIIQ